ncbi:MAG: hypothetical protein HRT58_12060 [Crocinitomicaceae bacterium]|nr:hypothetical protein [Flavobacteriales bacterium]NQZ36395.1 hypothetical protein [Crocinitomicaceae bacterium]
MAIHSPNNWLERAGAKTENGQLLLPINCLLVPMGLASEAILNFKKSDNLNDRIKFGIVVVTMVRIADTGYFRRVAKMIREGNKQSEICVCEHCLRGQLWTTEIKKYRKQVNSNIIHKMEEGLPINEDDLKYVELYYDEIFKHPLTNPISWEGKNGLQMCPSCLKKNKTN